MTTDELNGRMMTYLIKSLESGLLLKSVVNLIVFIVVGTGLSKVVKNR